MNSFCHLHVHSHYSLLDGASKIPELVSRAKELGMEHLALTDHGCMHGIIDFYKECKSQDINPCLGYEAYVVGDRSSKDDSNYHLTLLSKNRTGYQNLLKLASAAFLEGFYRKPRLDYDILSRYREGLIILSGCMASQFARLVLPWYNGVTTAVMSHFTTLQRIAGDDLYIEIMRNGQKTQEEIAEATIDFANTHGLPMVATADSHYTKKEDATTQDVLMCINTGARRADRSRFKLDGDMYFLRSAEEMYDTFSDVPQAVSLSQEIAEGISIELELGVRHFPIFDVPWSPESKTKTAIQYLRKLSYDGLKKRTGEYSPEYTRRLESELAVIEELGFPDYFLVVADIVQWCIGRGIMCTARGSGVGSLVCYCLFISHVDPIKFGLLFERFLDLSRREAPDIDLDLDKERRGEAMMYLKQKYGEDCVAQICTFGTLQPRNAIKDVCRVEGLPIAFAESLCDMVPELPGTSFDDCFDVPDFKKAYGYDEVVKKVVDLARGVEGTARSLGTHAAAVVVSPKPLVEYVPLARVTGKSEVVTQFDMSAVEDVGLIKLDLLGLRNLTVLNECVRTVYESTGEVVDIHKV